MRILIVDDDDFALEVLEHALTMEQHEVVVAHSVREALEILRTGSCHLVIADWLMPEVDGLELCRHIRKSDYLGYTYVILLTSRNRSEDIVAGLSAGADDFVAKPFDPAELLVRVRTGERILSLETRDLAMFAMAKLAEARDPETGAHLERVRLYSRIIAEHLSKQRNFREEVNQEFMRLIYQTSPLHDIGKVGIPDCVLLKPGRLDDREFEIMKTHTTIGAETLGAAVQRFPRAKFLRMAYDIVLTHHEKFDGSGYPQGLAGQDIPLCGRIVALADVYDAITSKRVYKEAFTHDIARGTVIEESGKHFDPHVVEAFIKNEDTFIGIRDSVTEAEMLMA